MNVMACGLNSYLGKASLRYLQGDTIQIHGLVRDQELLISKLYKPTLAKLYNVDVIRYNPYVVDIHIPDCHVAFYFTQTPELHDAVGANYELLSIRNYIHFAKKNNCNRIVYVSTIYDSRHLSTIEELFTELQMTYTIVLKDVAIGKGTSFEDFMIKMLKNRFIYLYKPTKSITLNPIKIKDLMSWLGSINWSTTYLNKYIKFEGTQSFQIEELMKMYQNHLAKGNKHHIITIQNKTFAKICNKYFSGIPYNTYADYISELIDHSKINNIQIVKSKGFHHSDLI
ncbi:hypothetical protein [Sphingobacterium bovistauri]|uniref:Nucleoside-diphosphate-sugar epimerase n=1 Tax=Sphingobacterium bovistauri TaxID=2781959 RepID=A0ABS7Z3L2_9SPHI|nr:hypothetical protein [Sphingobacterium bovistauri]MCA5004771.1 hypothetical protein [Sphingobacterium bovistauri]